MCVVFDVKENKGDIVYRKKNVVLWKLNCFIKLFIWNCNVVNVIYIVCERNFKKSFLLMDYYRCWI